MTTKAPEALIRGCQISADTSQCLLPRSWCPGPGSNCSGTLLHLLLNHVWKIWSNCNQEAPEVEIKGGKTQALKRDAGTREARGQTVMRWVPGSCTTHSSGSAPLLCDFARWEESEWSFNDCDVPFTKNRELLTTCLSVCQGRRRACMLMEGMWDDHAIYSEIQAEPRGYKMQFNQRHFFSPDDFPNWDAKLKCIDKKV